MVSWPPIDAPALVERLRLSDAGFRAMVADMAAAIGRRTFSDAHYEQAIGYPWPRPQGSYLLDADGLREPRDLSAGEIAAATAGRWPLLAFGSNAAPERLALKLEHLAPGQRRLLVVAGDLHGFDVGVAAHPTIYGAMPATLVPSPGTTVRAAVLWVTAEQLTALTWTEITYALGRLDGVRFDAELPGVPVTQGVLAYVSRWGIHRVAGEPVALAGIAARGRTAPAMTQLELLDGVARDALGAGAVARDLVAWVIEDFAAASSRVAPLLGARAVPFASAHWRRLGD